jgi:uncharacterized protein (UPF0332 family)
VQFVNTIIKNVFVLNSTDAKRHTGGAAFLQMYTGQKPVKEVFARLFSKSRNWQNDSLYTRYMLKLQEKALYIAKCCKCNIKY